MTLLSIFTFLPLFIGTTSAGAYPVLSDRPFVTVWNAPTRGCWDKFGVELDLGPFDIVINQNHSFIGTEVVIFYNTQLGLYPFYNQDVDPINGGLPQNSSLKYHLAKAKADLEATIYDPDFKGVAVVDWENWRPTWIRNWEKMRMYIQRSLLLVRQRYPYWPHHKVRKLAKREFEEAARDFMESTLKLGNKLRPGGFWGYYGFPSCYNYNYKNSSENYTGACPDVEMRRNNRLKWLWESSRALYPDIYLEKILRNSEYVGRFVRHRVQEAFRVTRMATVILPVLPYARIVYTYSMDFLTEEDLVQTLGQSAALGASGIILWGNADYSRSKESCLAVKSYVDETLGHYVINVTSAALLCSQTLCSGNGRCVRKDPSFNSYLHLHPDSFNIRDSPQDHGFVVTGKASTKDMSYLETHFQCSCYPAWKGTDCSKKS